jgi:hypothetical protein
MGTGLFTPEVIWICNCARAAGGARHAAVSTTRKIRSRDAILGVGFMEYE